MISAIIFILADLDLNLQTLASVALHHQTLTAKPLFEILRTMIAEISKNTYTRKKHHIDDDSQAIIVGVLGTINKEYEDIANLRNSLLHGTWYVGFTGPDNLEAKEFYVQKFATRAIGLVPLELPKTAAELNALTERCYAVRYWIIPINSVFLFDDGAFRLKEKFWFDKDRKKWLIRTPTGDETLPEK
jgi:hypothetical protein